MRERLLIQRLLVDKLGTKLYVPPGAVVEWYKKNKDLLAGPEVRTARVITVRFKETGAGDEAVAAARRKINRLRQEALGGGDFAKLAKRHSEDPWAPRGGLLDPIRDGDEASVFAAPLFKRRRDIAQPHRRLIARESPQLRRMYQHRPQPPLRAAIPGNRPVLVNQAAAKHGARTIRRHQFMPLDVELIGQPIQQPACARRFCRSGRFVARKESSVNACEFVRRCA